MPEQPATKERYGILWPDYATDLDIELKCWRHYDMYSRYPGSKLLRLRDHFKNAWIIISPETLPNGKKNYVFSEWTERRIDAWCDNNFMTWWGPSSSGKTTDAAHLVYITWLAAPEETTIQVCSTSKEMLQKRIWREIVRIHTRCKGTTVGVYVPSKMMIVLRGEEEEDNPINGLFGVPVGQGSKGIKGVHNTYNYMVIDEMQDTDPVAAEEWDNLSTGKDYKFLGMGNPDSWTNPLGIYSRPVECQMKDLDPDIHTEWKTAKGMCIFFDGRKSPGVRDPDTYHMLLTQKQIDEMKKYPGVNSPRFWTQRIGFIPREGLQETVLTESIIVTNGGTEEPVWQRSYITVAGLDPAFSNGGDKRVLRFARIGLDVCGLHVIALYRKIYLNVELVTDEDGNEIPASYDFARKVISACKEEGVKPMYLGMDVTSAQRTLADIIEKEWDESGHIHRVDFSGSPSEFLIKDGANEIEPRKIYKNRVTELWFNVSKYVRSKQIRGMDEEEIWQFCARRIQKPGDGTSRLMVEPKKQMKGMSGRSPDDADAVSCVTAVAREVLKMDFGGGPNVNKDSSNATDYDMDSRADNYSTDPTEME